MKPVLADSNKAVSNPWIAIKRSGSQADIHLRCSYIGLTAERATGTLSDPFDKVVDIRRGIVLDNIAIPFDGVIEAEKQNRSLGRGLRQLLLLASGQTVASFFALMALWASLNLNDISGLWILQPMVALALVRVWDFQAHDSRRRQNRYCLFRGLLRNAMVADGPGCSHLCDRQFCYTIMLDESFPFGYKGAGQLR